MRKFIFKGSIVNIITTTIVIIALLGISVFQYKWLLASAERDIVDSYRNMSFTIYRSISNELRHSFFTADKLFRDYDVGDDIHFKADLIESLNIINIELGDEYLKTIGFFTEDKVSYSYTGGQWSKDTDTLFNPGENGLFIPDRFDPGKVRFSFSPKGKERIVIFIYFDLYKFYKDRIEESLDPIIKDFELKWYFSLPENGKVINERSYSYSPIRFIKNKIFKNESTWYIGISLFMDMNKFRGGFKDNKFNLKRIAPERNHDTFSAFVDVYYNGKPLINAKEQYLTIQWILNLLLLFGLGISYFLILNQIRKLKKLRSKEKEFVASVTHELRTPLAVIHSAADNIKSGIITQDRLEQYGKLIMDQSKRLSSMVEGILLFSRFEGRGESPPVMSKVDVDKLEKVLQEISKIIEKEYNVKVFLDITLPDNFVSDSSSIELILTNLLFNSAKHAYDFSSTGGCIRMKAHLQLPNRLIFRVEDDGFGISSREKKDIFKPFFRGERSHVNQINGSGLGLFLTYKKTKLLGGDIKLQSPYERADGKIRNGCLFIVSIPYERIEKEITYGQYPNN